MPEEKPEIETQAVTPEPHLPSAQFPSARVQDKRVLPEGVVPKQAQGYVVVGLAVLILLAVMFSKNHAKTASAPAAIPPSTTAFSNDVNARRIAELEQNLNEEQRQSQQAQQQAQKTGAASSIAANAATTQPGTVAAPLSPAPAPATEPQRDPIADAEKAMAFKARFASNLVSSDVGASRPSASSADSADANVRSSSGTANPASRSMGLPSQAPALLVSSSAKRAPEVNINSAHGQPFVVFEGTTIDTVLTNRLDGEFAGPVKVMVSNPVYSHDGQHVLIPEGSFILGDVQKVAGFGQKRLAVTFHRLLMPDGYSVDLDQFHGLDQIGDSGLKDKVNNHYFQVFGSSIALGVIAGAAEATTNNGYNESGSDAYRQGIASSLSQSSANVLDRFINIPPTITIREGHRIKVYITQDMLLPAYENHDMPGVF
jgi:Type IV secretory pathway, VirB10 components